MRFGSALALTAVSGALYGLAFPPVGWWPLAWLALVPFLLAVAGGGKGRAAGLGVLLGVAASYGVGTWMPAAVVSYYEQPVVVGIAIFLVCALWQAAWQLAIFALVWRRLAAAPRAWTPLAVGAAWVTAELLRSHIPLGNPWALLGYSQTAAPLLVQSADVAGVHGIGFVLVALNAALALVWRAHGADMAMARRGLAIAAALVVAVVAYGAFRLTSEQGPAAAAAHPVVAVQGNLDLGTQWKSEFYGANLGAYADLTTKAVAAHPAPLVVWPESALTFFLEDDASYRAYLARVLTAAHTTLLTGGPRVAHDGASESYRNAAFVIGPTGAIDAVYEKGTLVPFAEYFPLAGDGLLRRQFGKVREFVPGSVTAQAPVATPAGAAGVMICNEAMLADPARARVRAGATWLVTLTNDSWVGRRHYAEIALAMVRLRAVETRRWLVRASTSGPSAIIDPAGRIVDRLPFAEAGVVRGAIAARRDLTIYARIGDVFAWACALLTALMVARVVVDRFR
ncbi:MAG: apolipoprotein N-acyltransferase [Candidatus Binatia bacterium]